MKQHIQTTFLGLSISLILTAFVVNADTAKTTTSQVNYGYYYPLDYPKKYHRFLPSPGARRTSLPGPDDSQSKY